MSLKEQFETDIDDIFLDVDENAEERVIDGEKILCILDKDKSFDNKVDGVYDVRRHLFVKESDLGYRPVPDQRMKVDDETYYVKDCIGEGLIEIILEAHES